MKHNGVLYSCNKCNYKAVRKATLKTHVNSEHEGISYNCDQCSFNSKRQAILCRHVIVVTLVALFHRIKLLLKAI